MINANLNKIAQELYGKIQTRFPSIKIGNEHAEVLSKKEDIPNARFFEFVFQTPTDYLGTVSITLDEEDGLVIQIVGDPSDMSGTSKHDLYAFIKSLRQFAKKRLLKFDIHTISHSNLLKRDYQFKAKRKESQIMEQKLYGTSKMSYQDLGEARLVIKHSKPVNMESMTGRSMNIESIYIENTNGERFKYPLKHLNGARALAEHVKHGGTPYDPIGKYIIRLSEEMGHLKKFKGYISRNQSLAESMTAVASKVMERIDNIKKELTQLQRPHVYEEFANTFDDRIETLISEDVINSLIEKLTVRSFNEELKNAFPYVCKLIDESDIPVKTISADELLTDSTMCETCKKDPCVCEDEDNQEFAEMMSFENFVSEIDEDSSLFSPDHEIRQRAIRGFNHLMSNELKGGVENINTIDSISKYIDDDDLRRELKEVDPELDARAVVQAWLYDNMNSLGPHADEVLHQLRFGDDENDDAEDKLNDEPPPRKKPKPKKSVDPNKAEEPPAEPMNESIKRKFINAIASGATLDTVVEVRGRNVRFLDMMLESGITPESIGYTPDNESGFDQMLEYISGFYNKEEQNFPLGGERIKTKLKKDFESGMFPNATEQDLMDAMDFINEKDPGAQLPISPEFDSGIDDKELQLGELMSDMDEMYFGEQHMESYSDMRRTLLMIAENEEEGLAKLKYMLTNPNASKTITLADKSWMKSILVQKDQALRSIPPGVSPTVASIIGRLGTVYGAHQLAQWIRPYLEQSGLVPDIDHDEFAIARPFQYDKNRREAFSVWATAAGVSTDEESYQKFSKHPGFLKYYGRVKQQMFEQASMHEALPEPLPDELGGTPNDKNSVPLRKGRPDIARPDDYRPNPNTNTAGADTSRNSTGSAPRSNTGSAAQREKEPARGSNLKQVSPASKNTKPVSPVKTATKPAATKPTSSFSGAKYGYDTPDEIMALQSQLNSMNYNIAVDGKWGPETEKAYNTAYQQMYAASPKNDLPPNRATPDKWTQGRTDKQQYSADMATASGIQNPYTSNPSGSVQDLRNRAKELSGDPRRAKIYTDTANRLANKKVNEELSAIIKLSGL